MSLASHLTALEKRGLIRIAQGAPELEYLFRHALIQETAYHTLVRADRRMLHQIVGESLERLLADELDSPEAAPMLAFHFAEAGDQPRALRYLDQAGRAAAQSHANAEAAQHFGRAIEVAQGLGIESERIADLYLRRGRALELNAQDAAAIENYEALEAWAAGQGEQRARLNAMLARATIYVKPSTMKNLPLGHELSQQALELARELGDPAGEAKALWNLLLYYLGVPDMAQAVRHGEMALDIARGHALRELTGYILTNLQQAYFQAGFPELALGAIQESLAIFRELGILNMLADNLGSAALVNTLAGNYEQALAHSAEAQQIARAIANLWNQSYALYMLDIVHFDRGDIGQAIATAEECLRLAELAGFSEGVSQAAFDLALIYGYMGAWPRAWEALRRFEAQNDTGSPLTHPPPMLTALRTHLHLLEGRPGEAEASLHTGGIPEDAETMNEWFFAARVFLVGVRAELALAAGQFERALALAEATLPQFKQNMVRLYLDDALALKGRALRALGRLEEAQAALEAARQEARERGARRALWETLAELALLLEARGDPEAARPLWREAAEIIRYIAGHAGSDDLAAAFLARREVARVLARAPG
jgi:tetratricopeptide (TPR) repeat protein